VTRPASDSTPKRPPPPRSTGASGRADGGPRRVRHGVKLRREPAEVVEVFAARAWLEAVAALIAPADLEAGLAYARQGQIVEMEIRRGLVHATVQGTAPRPYETKVNVAMLSPHAWDQLITAMAGEAVYAARLPKGELPDSISALADTVEVTLLPDAAAITAECTCAAAGPCRHVAALSYVVAERLADQPQGLFTLRGMTPDRVVDRLRQVRAIETRGVAAAHADPLIAESQVSPPSLESSLEEFWRSGPRLAELEQRPPAPHVAHALLRRLGPSPMKGRFPMVGLLASIYDEVSVRARTLRDQAGREDDEREDDERDADE
jgi:uncharacterized Zn finger protein